MTAAFDPSTLSLTGWWRETFSLGTWSGKASAGASSGRDLTPFNTAPTVGTSYNGQPSVHFDGTMDLQSSLTLASFLSASDWTMFFVGIPSSTGVANSATPYLNNCIVRGGADFWGCHYKAGPIALAHVNDGITDNEDDAAWAAFDKPIVITAKQTGGTMYIRTGKGAWTTQASGSITGLTGTLYVGSIVSAAYVGDMLELLLTNTALSDTVCNQLLDYAGVRYDLAGFQHPFLAKYPDLLERPQQGRNGVHVSRQSYASSINPKQLVAATPPYKRPQHPDRIERPSLLASQQQATSRSTVPLGSAQGLFAQPSSYPDFITRPFLLATQQLAAADMPAFPWLAGASTALLYQPPEFADSVIRLFYRPEHQQATTSISPVPERRAVLTDVRYPDRVELPTLRVEQQMFRPVRPPLAERTAVITDVRYPDAITRPFLRAEQHQSTAGAIPERTATVTDVRYPDAVTRPWFSTTAQQATAGLGAPLGSAQGLLSQPSIYPDALPWPRLPFVGQPSTPFQPPASITPVALTSYPDAIAVATMRRSLWAFAPATLERTSVLAAVSYPDAVARPFLRVEQQMVTAGTAPDRTSVLCAVAYPDAVTRPSAQQPGPWSTPFQPPVVVVPVGLTSYPDAITRPWLLTAEQLVTAGLGAPLGSAQALLAQPAIYPDSVTRPAAQQLGPWSTAFQPPIVAVTPVALVWYPDGVARLRITQQTSFALATRQSLTPVALTSYPDAATRPALPAAQQLAVTALSPLPYAIGAPFQPPVFPPTVGRPIFRAETQQAVTELPPSPVAASAWAIYPDAVTRPALRAEQQQALGYARIERSAPLASVISPDFITRPYLLAAEHPHFGIGTRPEVTIARDWYAQFPDAVLRPTVPASLQMPMTFWPAPLAIIPNTIVCDDAVVWMLPKQSASPLVGLRDVGVVYALGKQQAGVYLMPHDTTLCVELPGGAAVLPGTQCGVPVVVTFHILTEKSEPITAETTDRTRTE